MPKPRKALTVAYAASDAERPQAVLKGSTAGVYRQKLRDLRKLGIDPMKGVALSKIRTLADVPPNKAMSITRTYEVYGDLFRLPHIVVPFKVPPVPKVPKLLSEKQMGKMSDAALERYTARLERFMSQKREHDEKKSRLLAAQDFGGHKYLDPNLKAAVIPVISGDPKKARLSFAPDGTPILRDAQGQKTHVPFDHQQLAKRTDKYLDELVKKHGPDKRFQLVMSGQQFITWNVSGSELKSRVKKLMTSSSGKHGKYKDFLRGIMVYRENSLSKAQRLKNVERVLLARAQRELPDMRNKRREQAKLRQRRQRIRNDFIR